MVRNLMSATKVKWAIILGLYHNLYPQFIPVFRHLSSRSGSMAASRSPVDSNVQQSVRQRSGQPYGIETVPVALNHQTLGM